MNTSSITIAALAFAASSLPASALIFQEFGTPGAITDDGVTTFELNVAPSFPVFGPLEVGIDMDHTWAGDLTITLEHNGTSVTLLDRLGVPEDTVGNGADFAGLYVFGDSGASWSPFDVTGANSGVVIPEGSFGLDNSDGTSLADFAGMEANGLWTLTISDGAFLDTGVVNSWYIAIVPAPGAAALLGMGALAASRRQR